MARAPKSDEEPADFHPIPNATQELDTSELSNMETSGVASAKPNLLIQLEGGEVLELQPGWSQQPEGSVIVDDGPSVIVSEAIPSHTVPAPAKAITFAAPPARAQGFPIWVVVLAYVLAGAALALAVRERFF